MSIRIFRSIDVPDTQSPLEGPDLRPAALLIRTQRHVVVVNGMGINRVGGTRPALPPPQQGSLARRNEGEEDIPKNAALGS
jgi:hypothetical protein